MKNEKVTAVVVTYNRKELLTECLMAILNQSIKVRKIIVINNASTDGTEKLFEKDNKFYNKDIVCVNMKENTGGSGGFFEGLKMILEEDTDWAWIMDDDTIPKIDCLERILEADRFICDQKDFAKGKRKISFYASTIFGKDGEFMNVPTIDTRPSSNGYSYFYEFLKHGLIHIMDATFVSLLIKKDAIKQCGLPCKDYFIWGDDGEYTLRLTHNYGEAYMVGASEAIHKRVGAKSLSINNFDEPERIKMYHYYVRNNIINSMFYRKDRNKFITFAKKIIQALSSIKYILKKNGFLKMVTIWRGTFEGFFQYKKFQKYIKSQLKQND